MRKINGGRTLHFKKKSGKLKEKRSIARCVPQAGEAMENKCVIKNSKTVDLFYLWDSQIWRAEGLFLKNGRSRRLRLWKGQDMNTGQYRPPDKLIR